MVDEVVDALTSAAASHRVVAVAEVACRCRYVQPVLGCRRRWRLAGKNRSNLLRKILESLFRELERNWEPGRATRCSSSR